jgi:hypothetical protein
MHLRIRVSVFFCVFCCAVYFYQNAKQIVCARSFLFFNFFPSCFYSFVSLIFALFCFVPVVYFLLVLFVLL